MNSPMANQIRGIYMCLVAAAVAIHYVIWPFYGYNDDGTYNLTIWKVIDWFMLVAVLMLVGSALRRAKAVKSDAGGYERVFAGVSMIVALGFMANFVDVFWGDGAGNSTIWHLIDMVLPVLLLGMGTNLLRGAANSNS